MTAGQAVRRLTGEIAEWFGIDAGILAIGRRADLVVLDPTRLGPELDVPLEAPMPEFGGFVRLVSQNGGAVRDVLVRGRAAIRDGQPTAELGRVRGLGQVLRATG